MKPRGIITAAGAVAVALALTVFGGQPFAGSTPALAKGPSNLSFDAILNGGAALPGVGTAVSSGVQLGIDVGGTAPSDNAFFDQTLTTFTGVQPAASPSGAHIGAKTGSISFTIHTNQYPLTLSSGVSPTYGDQVPQCGDNTRDYNGDTTVDGEGLVITSTLFMYTANMANVAQPTYLFSTDPGFVLATFQSEHPSQGSGAGKDTKWIQSYDDDNTNGLSDALEPGVGSTAEPVPGGGAADPWKNNSPLGFASSVSYLKGTPETQEDYDGNGIPNGVEYMIDFLPEDVSVLGLSSYWVSRSYGVAVTFPGQTPGTDVSFLGFSGIPDGSADGMAATESILANPFSPSNPAFQRTVTCTPFSVTVTTGATTVSPDFNQDGDSTDGPEATILTGDNVQTVTEAGAGNVSLTFSDTDDYDKDGIAPPYDLCDTSSTNSDADKDLVSGSCDAVPANVNNSAGPAFMTEDGNASDASCFDGIDNGPDGLTDFADPDCGNGTIYDNDVDGDGWLNATDNCPRLANANQLDQDSDSVGDACDPLITTDNIASPAIPSGKGDGTAESATYDNDAKCVDAYTTTEPSGDAPTCTSVFDAGDDGTPDVTDFNSDEDGDGNSDACEGQARDGAPDTDGDKAPDACEDLNGNGTLDAGETCFSATEVGCAAPATKATDFDGDGVKDGLELATGTDPLVDGGYNNPVGEDTDGDGCKDSYELANGFNPGYFWDIYDVGTNRGATPAPGDENFTADGKVNFGDVLITLDHFGHNATQAGHVDNFDMWLDRNNRKAAADNVFKPAGFGLPNPIDRGVGKTVPLSKLIAFEQENSVTFTDVLAALDGFGTDCSAVANKGVNIVNPVTGAGIPNLGGIH
jgi:hypothetical protein